MTDMTYPPHLIDAIVAITDGETCKRILDLADELKGAEKQYYEGLKPVDKNVMTEREMLKEIYFTTCRIEGYIQGSNEGLVKRLEAIEDSIGAMWKRKKSCG